MELDPGDLLKRVITPSLIEIQYCVLSLFTVSHDHRENYLAVGLVVDVEDVSLAARLAEVLTTSRGIGSIS